jgi:hypothetical protein
MTTLINGVSLNEMHDAYQGLYDALTSAYWAASTIEDKDRIQGMTETVYDIVSALNVDILEANTPAFLAVKSQISDGNTRLDKLKQQIDQMVHAVKIATQVAAGVDKAISLAAKYFGL